MKHIFIQRWFQQGTHIILALGLAGFLWGTMISSGAGQAAAAVTWPVVHLQLVANGLPSPVSISHADDNSGRLYIVQKGGTIQILQHGALVAAPFLDIHTLVSTSNERGLLGLAFPTGYASKGHFFIYYTNLAGTIVIARYNVSANHSLADPASGVIVLTIDHPLYDNHNGGQLAFGPDGFLYAGVGDGGSGGDPNNHGQSFSVLLAKILRIDVEGSGCVQNPAKAQNYCIPTSNPYVSTSGDKPEIWALGLRNPWKFSFDRLTGDLYIGDVGQNIEEEIDFQPAASTGGENYGWKILEGNLCYSPATGCVDPPRYSAPVTVYDHMASNSNGCAVIGGYVYRGPNIFLDMQGVYFYADYCQGKIYGLENSAGWQTNLLTTAPFFISAFGEDESGFIYVADFTDGAIYQLQGAIDPAALPLHTYFPIMTR